MSKIINPLKAKVLKSLDSLENQERDQKPALNDEPQPLPVKSSLNNQYALDEEVPTTDNQADRFVTRNYSFIASIDTDIDRLRMALKQKGRKYTKQELVNILLKERLGQLSEKGIF